MGLEIQVQILNQVVCVSLCANAFRKGMNPSILCLPMDKLSDTLDSLALIKQPV